MTGSPGPVPPFCNPEFTQTATPLVLNLTRGSAGVASGTVTKTVTSICNYAGTLFVDIPFKLPTGFTITVSPSATFVLPAGGSVTLTETFSVDSAATAGIYKFVNRVTNGGAAHADVTITIFVS